MTGEIEKNAAQVLEAPGDQMQDSYRPPSRLESLELAPIGFSDRASRGGGLSPRPR